MKELIRIVTAEITFNCKFDNENEISPKDYTGMDIKDVLKGEGADHVNITNIQDFIIDKDEQKQNFEIRFSLNDVERIIEGKKRRLDDLERCWNDFTRHMECGEIRELKQSCIDDEIIIACLEKFLHPAPWKDAMMQHFVKGD